MYTTSETTQLTISEILGSHPTPYSTAGYYQVLPLGKGSDIPENDSHG